MYKFYNMEWQNTVIIWLLLTVVRSQRLTYNLSMAVMVLHEAAVNGPCELDANYTDAGSVSTTHLQPGWQQGLQIFRDHLNSQQKFIVRSTNDSIHLVHLRILFFAVALPNDNPATQLLHMKEFMYRAIAGEWGYLPVILAPPTPTLEAAPVDQLAQVCETTQACLLILPITVDPLVFICQPLTAAQPDCLERNRRYGRRRFDYTITVAPPSTQVSDHWLSSMRIHGMTSLAILQCPNWALQAQSAIRVASTLGVEVLYNYVFNPEGNLTVENWTDILQSMYAMYPAIEGLALFIGYSHMESRHCARILRALKQMNRTPKALHFACSCTANLATVDPEVLQAGLHKYGYGVAPWHPEAAGPEYRALSVAGVSHEPFEATDREDSPAIFWKALTARFPTVWNRIISAQAALAPLLVQKAVEIMGVWPPRPCDLRVGLQTVSQSSHYGRLSLDTYGRFSDRPYPITQWMDWPMSMLLFPTGRFTPVFPAPTWKEREYTPQWFGSVIEQFFAWLAGLCQLYSVLLLVVLARYRTHRIIRAATPSFCTVIIVGTMIWTSSVFVSGLYQNNWTCVAQIWCLALGYTMVMGGIALKTYRILSIAGSGLEGSSVSTKRLFLILGALLVFVFFHVGVWMATDRPIAQRIPVDIHRPALDITLCRGGSTHLNFIVSLFLLGACLLLFNLYLAVSARRIPVLFNESRSILWTVYTVVMLSILVVPISLSSTTDRHIVFYIRTAGVLLGSIGVLSSLFIPKLLIIFGQLTRPTIRPIQTLPTPPTPPTPITGHPPPSRPRRLQRLAYSTPSAMVRGRLGDLPGAVHHSHSHSLQTLRLPPHPDLQPLRAAVEPSQLRLA